MIPCIEKIDALVAGISRDDIQRKPPLHRQRLAQALRHIADLADPPKTEKPQDGVLGELKYGAPRD